MVIEYYNLTILLHVIHSHTYICETDNAHRLITKTLASPLAENGHDKVDGDATTNPVFNSTQKEAASANSTPKRNRLTLHFEHTPIRNSAHFKEAPNIPSNHNMYGKGELLFSKLVLYNQFCETSIYRSINHGLFAFR